MAVEVALAMLHRDGRWLMQLRDEIPDIVAPGCWGLFGGHLDPGETPEQALRRELLEEISWQPPAVELVMVHHIHRRTAHVFQAELSGGPGLGFDKPRGTAVGIDLERQAQQPSPPRRWTIGGDAARAHQAGLNTTKPGAMKVGARISPRSPG